MRRPVVKKWEIKTASAWDAAKPGSSALEAAYMRLLECEIIIYRNAVYAGCHEHNH